MAITGRVKEARSIGTQNWIASHFPNFFEAIYYTNQFALTNITKSQVCKNLDISLMIDDNMDFALELCENGITTILLEKPWNKHRDEMHPNLIRVKTWQEIPTLISQYAKTFS